MTAPRPRGSHSPRRLRVLHRVFSPIALLWLVHVLDLPAQVWRRSQRLGRSGRGATLQIPPTNLRITRRLAPLRTVVTARARALAERAGYDVGGAAAVQVFPVRMIGDAKTPPFQRPHRDSTAALAEPPICSCVLYVVARDLDGGALVTYAETPAGLAPVERLAPAANTMAIVPGDRLHGVEPLYRGERISVVTNFYSGRRATRRRPKVGA